MTHKHNWLPVACPPTALYAFALFGGLVLLPLVASASHYPLNAIDIASSEETYALYKAGVTDTKTLLEGAGKAPLRAALAKKTKLTTERLKALAAMCDLLQIKGVGPTVARLLLRCKIPTLAALKAKSQADAAALSACMARVNKESPLTELTPSIEFLENWIRAAKDLESLVD